MLRGKNGDDADDDNGDDVDAAYDYADDVDSDDCADDSDDDDADGDSEYGDACDVADDDAMMLIMIMMVALGRVNENGSESKLCIRQNIMISELAGRLAGCWLLAGLLAGLLLASG